MAQITWVELRGLLADRYDELRFRLKRRLGSEELASETLHETWLRLHRQDGTEPVQSPVAYLMRMAINIATDFRRAEQRKLRSAEVSSILEIADPAPGPEQLTVARQQFDALRRAVDQLPERTRAILTAARLDGEPHQAIADRLGISRRMVQIELKRAVEYCEAQLENLENKPDADFAFRRSPPSIRTPGNSPGEPASPRKRRRREVPNDDGS